MDTLSKINLESWFQLGFFGVLVVFSIGAWRILKPAADAWLEQYKILVETQPKMVEIMTSINVNLILLIKGQDKILNGQGDMSKHASTHEQSSERRHNEAMRGLRGGLGWKRNNAADS